MIHYTSIEQSKHLIELGLNPNTADMYYFVADSLEKQETNYAIRCGTPIVKTDIPCWSLGALLEVMPKSITDEYDSKGWLGMCALYDPSWRWIVYYTNDDIDSPALHEEQGKTLLEATYNMVCWLLENDYINKEVSKI